jgi:hypothetical protein
VADPADLHCQNAGRTPFWIELPDVLGVGRHFLPFSIVDNRWEAVRVVSLTPSTVRVWTQADWCPW